MSTRTSLGGLALRANERIGPWVPRGIRTRIYRQLYPHGAPQPMKLNIDIVGSCNLRCPSCPVGNTGQINPPGIMKIELFEEILEKAQREHKVKWVGLYNWTEPLLHPRLPEFIRAVKRRGLLCGLSSNLNLMRDIDAILLAKPDEFRISLSGFTQGVYGVTHASGDIEKVKANMRELSEAKRRLGLRQPRIHVFYHKYRNNLGELQEMRDFAESLGFDWMDTWAYYMPVERALELVEGRLPVAERTFIEEQFALPVVQAIEATRDFHEDRCTLLEDALTLNVHGEISLCCAVYDTSKYGLGKFLDLTPAALAEAKASHPMCGTCISAGIHLYTTAYSNPPLQRRYEELVKENLARGMAGDELSVPIVRS